MSATPSPNPSQPSNDALTTSVIEGVAAKDVRAHEHARHRAKERRVHAQAKERKEKAAVLKSFGIRASSHGCIGAAKPSRKLTMESWDGDDLGDAVPLPLPSHKPSSSVALEACAPPRSSTGSFAELTLADLVSVPRPRKGKKLDFEVIPPIRAVIALDDIALDVEPDEPWEYVSRASLDNEFTQGRSYAQAAAAGL
ncbi:hypothetical protein ID866_3629 [Astraeus odoratus]|nr:hypothetical protein ID866_3629 [Astraeus odoratus]